MDPNKLHKMLKPLPNDFDEFIRTCFQGAWTGYVGIYYPEPQFVEDVKPEKMLYCSQCKTYIPTDIKIGGKERTRNVFCPNCLEQLDLYSLKQKRTSTERHQTFWIGQNLGNKIFVLRGFRVTLRLYSPECGEEEIVKQEIRRLYISPEECYREYCGWGYDQITQKFIADVWQTRAAGFACASGPIYPATFEEAKGTGAEYAHLMMARDEGCYFDDENWSERWGTSGPYYLATNNKDSIWDYLSVYVENRRIEMLLKLNMPYIIGLKMRKYPTGLNGRAKNPWDYLKIYKSRLKGLTCTDGNEWTLLNVYRLERRSKNHFTDEEVEALTYFSGRERSLYTCLKYMSARQLINRVNKYYGDKVKYSKIDVMGEYADYLDMKAKLGYDMTNSITVYPHDLKAEHDKAVLETNERKAEERKKKVNEDYKEIGIRFKKANKVYAYHSGKLSIRPAKDAAEIVAEGRALHHCVGGDNYLMAHAHKTSIILFLREKDSTPYITVEMSPKGKILQWYGAYDKKPDKEKINRWLNKYTKQLDKKALLREARTKGA